MRLLRAPRTWIIATGLILVSVILLFFSGRVLVVDNAQPSDEAIVLAGGFSDVRLQQGLCLLQKGLTRELIVDESTQVLFGRKYFEYALDYVQSLPAGTREHVHVCVFTGDSTQLELRGILPCAKAVEPKASKVILVTSQFHTRRALSVAKRLFPQYAWTASAAPDPEFGINWWRDREWAKVCLTEWEKMLWWQTMEKWRA